MKLGSLFDGSGGFPLVAALCGITPVWASEVEPYPIAVTKSRFPKMKHLGDISKINGAEIEPVDVITFGSPCQDLSVAGKRAGLKHTENGDDETTRSGLFMEAVRIIKEMREATNGVYPRFALWENVPGAFSSNKGEDFRIVLEELIKIVEPSAVMPAVPKAGWAYADSYVGDGWSIAYRVFDAQYWGVPQRRRRIYLVADFRGECAGKILFEREGLRGYPTEGGTPWQGTAADAEGSSGADDREGAVGIDGYNADVTGDKAATLGVNCGMSTGRNGVIYAVDQGGGKSSANVSENLSPTLTCTHGGEPAVAYTLEPGIAAREGGHIYEGVSGTLRANVGDNQLAVVHPMIDGHILDDQGRQQVNVCTDGKSPTLRAEMHGNVPCVMKPVVEQHVFENHSQDTRYKGPLEVCPMLPAQLGTGGNNTPFVVESKAYESHPQDSRIKELDGVAPTVSRKWHKGAADTPLICEKTIPIYIVRRLIPTECARLQGFPDEWGHIESKGGFIEEEYRFWCKVNLEYGEMQGSARPDGKGWYEIWREVKPNKKKGEDFEPYWENIGKPYKHKTKKQMLTWYNKLWTDSSEYKMWGNGIAKPTALYVMQGIAEVYKEVS